jgi:CubicO group peptidase (beta-lactamase class C family)
VTAVPIGGTTDARFGAVRDAFLDNFERHGERGAAVSVVVDGTVVVDLWGGYRDEDMVRPWEADTLVNLFSVGKALVAVAAARLVGEGRLSLDEPLASWWPAFGSEGKEGVTLRHVLSHTAGCPAIRRPLGDDAVYQPTIVRDALADEPPWWPPGEAHGYHVNTFGFLAGAAIEHAASMTVGTYLRDEVCGPLRCDLHLGVPVGDLDRCAAFHWDATVPDPKSPSAALDARFLSYFNPRTFSGLGVVNTEQWRRCEHPSTNLHGTARGVARLFCALANRGELDGTRIVDRDVLREFAREHASGQDRVLDRPSRFGLGFQLTMPERPIGQTPGTFGHFGAGGSLGFCEPERKVAFGYVTNDMGPRWQNPRNRGLMEALGAALR